PGARLARPSWAPAARPGQPRRVGVADDRPHHAHLFILLFRPGHRPGRMAVHDRPGLAADIQQGRDRRPTPFIVPEGATMRARIAQALFGATIALLCGIAAADTVRIIQINNPELVELKRLPDGEYLWASDLE